MATDSNAPGLAESENGPLLAKLIKSLITTPLISIADASAPLRKALDEAGVRVVENGIEQTRAIVLELRVDADNGIVDARDSVAKLRGRLPRRVTVFVLCPANTVVCAWLALRLAGFEPKRTVFAYEVFDQPATYAIIVCRHAKRGGMSVEQLGSEP